MRKTCLRAIPELHERAVELARAARAPSSFRRAPMVHDLPLSSCSQLAHVRLATAGDSQEASTSMSSPSYPQATSPV